MGVLSCLYKTDHLVHSPFIFKTVKALAVRMIDR